jgi:hypothetical protein
MVLLLLAQSWVVEWTKELSASRQEAEAFEPEQLSKLEEPSELELFCKVPVPSEHMIVELVEPLHLVVLALPIHWPNRSLSLSGQLRFQTHPMLRCHIPNQPFYSF